MPGASQSCRGCPLNVEAGPGRCKSLTSLGQAGQTDEQGALRILWRARGLGAGCQGLRGRRSGWSTGPTLPPPPAPFPGQPRKDSPPLRRLPPCPPGCAKPRPPKGAPHGTHLALGQLPQRRSRCRRPQEEHAQGGGGGGTPGSRNQGQRLGRTALPGHGTPHFLIRPSQLPGEADTSIPTAELRKGSVTCLRFNRPSGKVELGLFPLSWLPGMG